MKKKQSMNKKNIFLNLLGIFFLILGTIAVINALYEYDIFSIIWFCYLGLLLIGLGILLRKDWLIVSQLNILAIPMLIWTIDFIYVFLTGGILWGISNYFFEQGPIISKLVTTQHLYTIPLSLVALHLIKLKTKNSWQISFLQATIFYFLIYFFTPIERNLNCVFEFCGDYQVQMLYPLIWFGIYFSMIFLTNFSLNKFFSEK